MSGRLRFAAIGDAGKGNDAQYQVAQAMTQVCAQRGGCSFAVMLGDNFYPTGVSSATDPQWVEKFERPYANVPFPFWVVLGNHDYGGDGMGNERNKVDAEIEYALTHPKFKLPARHYAFTESDVDFVVLDTNAAMWDWSMPSQTAATDQRIQQSVARGAGRWRIAMGHHPYLSNGRHGNAGSYDGVPSFVPVAPGVGVKDLLDQHVCGKVDLYLSGHDHNLQDLVRSTRCGMELVVSGGGASTTDLEGSNPAHFQASKTGFFLIDIDGRTLTLSAFDALGQQLHTRTLRK